MITRDTLVLCAMRFNLSSKLAYRRLDLQLRREGRHPWELTESEIYNFKLRDDALTAEMLSMRRLYEEKSHK